MYKAFALHFTYQWTVDVGGLIVPDYTIAHNERLVLQIFPELLLQHVAWYLAVHKNHSESKTKVLLRFSYSRA